MTFVDINTSLILIPRGGYHIRPMIEDSIATPVDNMIDRTPIGLTQPNDDKTMHTNLRCVRWGLNRVLQHYPIPKETINSKSPSSMRGNIVRDFISRIPVLAILVPDILIGNIIWDLALIKVETSTISVPEGLESLEMFDEDTVRRNVVCVDHQSILRLVIPPAYIDATVIGAPEPDIVDEDVVRVNHETACDGDICFSTADTGKDIENCGWIRAMVDVANIAIADL